MTILDKLKPSKLFDFSKPQTQLDSPRIYSRGEHEISRKNIAESALKVLYRLHKAGFEAYLVGGAVRDLLLGLEPKDFDVATNARPEEVCELFRNARMIGRRFKLVHVRFGREIIEVATFRAAPLKQAAGADVSAQGRILRDNVYGELVDDAWRRDFTINALYYNIADFSIVDYVDGVTDLRAKKLRLIGDADVRYVEDPMRLLRAIRFAAKLGVEIDKATATAFIEHGDLLAEISPARMFDEIIKLFHSGAGERAVDLLLNHQLLPILFPSFNQLGAGDRLESHLKMVRQACRNTDERIAADKSVTPAFLFAAILWEAQQLYFAELRESELPDFEKSQRATDRAIEQQLLRIAIPRRFTSYVREIWSLQNKFEKRTPKRVERLYGHRRFRAAYDFLLLRDECGEDLGDLAKWWTQFEQGNNERRAQMMQALSSNRPKRKRRNPKKRLVNKSSAPRNA